MTYRNRKLLDLAKRINECQFRLPGCRGYAVDGCEPAHSNQGKHGKGKGLKAADDQHVAACHHCHMIYDGQTGMVLPRQDAVALFDEGRARTFAYYEKQGWLAEVGYEDLVRYGISLAEVSPDGTVKSIPVCDLYINTQSEEPARTEW